jgi:hypothetical protein
MDDTCVPTVIFIVLSAITIIAQTVSLISNYTANGLLLLIGAIVSTILWVILLNYLCSIDWVGLAWFLVLFPIVLIVLIVLLIGEVVFTFSLTTPTLVPTYRPTYVPTYVPTYRPTYGPTTS